MADAIICPVCGEANPADMEFCRNCQSRLQPLTGALKREGGPIQPGDLPTKKVTSELEPLLPQWLRDARQQARDSAAEDASEAEAEEPSTPLNSASDLLAGLESQSKEEEEEVPEWLAHITGTPSTKKKVVPDDNQVKWVELGRADEPQEPPSDEGNARPTAAPLRGSEDDALADWFKQAAASSETADFRLPAAPADASPSLTDQPKQGENPATPAPQSEDLSWLSNLDSGTPQGTPSSEEQAPAMREEAPDWLKKLQAEQTPPEPPQQPNKPDPSLQAQVPDWLRRFEEETAAAIEPEPQPQVSDQPLPDWLKPPEPSVPQEVEAPYQAQIPEEPAGAIELPDWISSLGETQPSASVDETAPSASTGEPAQPEQPPGEPAIPTELPDWIAALGQTQESAAATQPTPPASVPEPREPEPTHQEPAISAELPDWLAALRQPQEPSESAQQGPQAFETESVVPEQPTQEAPSPGDAFIKDAFTGGDVDAIFASMQTPDWLTGITPGQPPIADNVPAAAQDDQAIGPAELPSWVQAMRPVESALSAAPAGNQEGPTEERGPLAGLHGVLPSIPGAAAPSSKPKPHSIKLDASEQQQAHAALLERILAAETSPIPMRSSAMLRSQRALRWIVSLLLIVVVGGMIFSGTQMFPLPSAVPGDEASLAMSAANAIPSGAPVLLIFDYQPSTVGEMEAAGAPLVERLLVLKQPHLVLLSTSPTGPALAERFMASALPDLKRTYQRDLDYVDLGYLPGGLAGVYNFAQNPSETVPLDANSRPVWQSAILGPVRRFSDFAAVIVLTDSVEAGRSWIEQTASSRGSSIMILASSAQAGPMLLPYVDSGQVNGLVSGINGGAAAEQANVGLPGLVRRYWDAYSMGLYLAAGLILVGGLWSLLLGVRDRRTQAVG